MTPLLKGIRCPTDIVHGGGNRVVPLEKARMASAIPGAHLHVTPDACHGLHRRHPEVLARLLLQLVDYSPADHNPVPNSALPRTHALADG